MHCPSRRSCRPSSCRSRRPTSRGTPWCSTPSVVIPTWPTHAVVPLHTMFCSGSRTLGCCCCPRVRAGRAWAGRETAGRRLRRERVERLARAGREHPAVHTPAEQFGVPPLQTFPHAPQLFLSLRTSMQEPLQYTWPSAQQFRGCTTVAPCMPSRSSRSGRGSSACRNKCRRCTSSCLAGAVGGAALASQLGVPIIQPMPPS